jgi:hypothetical protein
MEQIGLWGTKPLKGTNGIHNGHNKRLENWPVDDPGNYRSMSLVSHIGKLFTSTINTRWLYPFQWLKNRKCNFRWIFLSNSSEGGPVFIFKCGSRKEKYLGRCLPWSKEEEGAYIFLMKQVPVSQPWYRVRVRVSFCHHLTSVYKYCDHKVQEIWIIFLAPTKGQ